MKVTTLSDTRRTTALAGLCVCILFAVPTPAGAKGAPQSGVAGAEAPTRASALCVIRSESSTFKDVLAPVKMDGIVRGTLTPGTYVCFAAAPGPRTLQIGQPETATRFCEENRPGAWQPGPKRIEESFRPLMATVDIAADSAVTYFLEPYYRASQGCWELLDPMLQGSSRTPTLFSFKKIGANDAAKLMKKYSPAEPLSSATKD